MSVILTLTAGISFCIFWPCVNFFGDIFTSNLDHPPDTRAGNEILQTRYQFKKTIRTMFCQISRSKVWHFSSRYIEGRKFDCCLSDPAPVHNILSHFKIQILTFPIQIPGRQIQFFFVTRTLVKLHFSEKMDVTIVGVSVVDGWVWATTPKICVFGPRSRIFVSPISFWIDTRSIYKKRKKQFSQCFVKFQDPNFDMSDQDTRGVNFIFVCQIPPVCTMFCHISRSKFWHFPIQIQGRKLQLFFLPRRGWN